VLGPFTFDGGTILFPISLHFRRHTDRSLWVFPLAARHLDRICGVIIDVACILCGREAAICPEWQFQESFDRILGVTPRIVLASLIAYFAGEFSNSFTLAKMKIATGGNGFGPELSVRP